MSERINLVRAYMTVAIFEVITSQIIVASSSLLVLFHMFKVHKNH